MKKPFFFRVDLIALMDFATEPAGMDMSLLQFAKELNKGQSGYPEIQKIIDEAHNYIEKKKNAGKKGGQAKSSSAKANPSSAKANPSTPLASNSNNSSNSNNTETKEKNERHSGAPAPSALFDLWNKIIDKPKARDFTASREKKCRARLKEKTLEEWEAIFQRLKNTPFCNGNNKSGWSADLDWIIANDNNNVRLMEGFYGGSDKPKQPQLSWEELKEAVKNGDYSKLGVKEEGKDE